MRTLWRLFKWLALAVVALAAVAVILLFTVDPENYRGTIERQAQNAVGRDVTIGGELDLKIGLSPAITLGDVTVVNLPDGSRPEMVRIGLLEVEVELIPLIFGGELNVTRLVLNDADILLEQTPEGGPNWAFGPEAAEDAAEPGGAIPFFQAVALENVTLTYNAPDADPLVVRADTAQLTADAPDSPLSIAFDGAVGDLPLGLEGTVGALSALIGEAGDWPVDLDVSIGDATASAEGSIGDLAGNPAIDLSLMATIPDLAALGETLAVPGVPALPPIDLSAGVSGTGEAIELSEGQLTIGDATFFADGSIGLAGAPAVDLSIRATVPDPAILAGAAGMADIPDLPRIDLSAGIAGTGQQFTIADGQLTLGDATFTAAGSVDLAAGPAIDLRLTGDVPDPTALGGDLGVADLPALPASTLSVAVAGTPAELRFTDGDVALGSQALGFDGTVGLAAMPLRVDMQIASDSIDLEALPGSEGGAAEPAPATDGPLVPETPLPTEALAGVEGGVGLTLGELRSGEQILASDVDLVAEITGGRLSVNLAQARAYGGSLAGTFALDGSGGVPSLSLSGQAAELDLAVLGGDAVESGRVGGNLSFSGTGETVRAAVLSGTGNAEFLVGPTEVTNQYLDLVGAGIMTALLSQADPPATSQLNCAIGRFDLSGGTVRSTAFVADLRSATIAGEIAVDLEAEQLDVLLRPESKEASLLPLDTPVRLTGPIREPSVNVLTEELIRDIGTSVLLRTVNPAAMLVPLVDPGADGSGGCVDAADNPRPSGRSSLIDQVTDGIGDGLEGVGVGEALEGTVEGIGEALEGTGIGDLLGTGGDDAADTPAADGEPAPEQDQGNDPIGEVEDTLRGLFGN